MNGEWSSIKYTKRFHIEKYMYDHHIFPANFIIISLNSKLINIL